MRRKIGIFVGVLVVLSGATTFLPGFRLGAELAAAQREGLWVSTEEIARSRPPLPKARNAMTRIAPLDDEERLAARGRFFYPLNGAVGNTIKGYGSPDERAAVRAWVQASPGLAARWRAASRLPEMSAGIRWNDGYGKIWNVVKVRQGQSRLLAAARLGIDPRENLLAVVRLNRLVRQEPGMVAQFWGIDHVHETLEIARAYGCAREVAKTMGPLFDARLALGPELPTMLLAMDQLRDSRFRRTTGYTPTVTERIRQWAPLAAGSKAKVIHLWRGAWAKFSRHPNDPRKVARDLRELREIRDVLRGYCNKFDPFLEGYVSPGSLLQTFAVAEDERRAALGEKTEG